MTMIALNLQRVQARIEAACHAAARAPDSVRLLAVSKTFGADAVREALRAGQRSFGENYVQEAVEKITLLQGLGIQWHLIGPLQANKTRVVAAHFDWVHSVDRLRIAERLSAQRPPERGPLAVCLQVNIDGGANKSGIAPDDLPLLARQVAALPQLALRGLMSIPEPTDDPAALQAVHGRARALFDQVGEMLRRDGLPGAAAWDTLSLGMTADLEAAIAAGSTLVRVGTAIFGRRPHAAGPAPLTSSPGPAAHPPA